MIDLSLSAADILRMARPICDRYGFDPDWVYMIELRPKSVTFHVYVANAEGRKHVGEDYEVATAVHTFRVPPRPIPPPVI